jgi:hypothetical protein
MDRNSMLYWFPPIEAAGLPVPKTEIVRFDNRTLWPALDGAPIPDVPWDDFRAACERIGLPCFVRSDQSSAKHDGPSAYRIDTLEKLEDVLVQTFEDSVCKDLEVLAFAFRAWLDLEAPFRAFGLGGKGHPIAREWRLFATGNRCLCSHFYWPEGAITGMGPDCEDWRQKLATLGEPLPEPELGKLERLAVEAVRALGEQPTRAWSVDFAKDIDGRWWLIDMAAAESSWHPEDCPYRGISAAAAAEAKATP